MKIVDKKGKPMVQGTMIGGLAPFKRGVIVRASNTMYDWLICNNKMGSCIHRLLWRAIMVHTWLTKAKTVGRNSELF